MSDTGYVLGIDTSNYRTSVAVTDRNGQVICDIREFLEVREGHRGLRQSDALFQHVRMLPVLMKRMRDGFDGSFSAVAYSSKPRPVEGSYMPVFMAGKCAAESIAAAADIPVFQFSHQEGHIQAVKSFSPFAESEHIMACHFSGGTCELLDVKMADGHENRYDISIAGGSKDISFGQVIDRAGVMLGMGFPAGEEMDSIAASTDECSSMLTPVKVSDAYINLSGLDTQMRNRLEKIPANESDALIKELFVRIGDAVVRLLVQGAEKTGCSDVIMAGGVSSSRFIRNYTKEKAEKAGLEVFFDSRGLSQDNAVGTALLGGMELWG